MLTPDHFLIYYTEILTPDMEFISVQKTKLKRMEIQSVTGLEIGIFQVIMYKSINLY